jgi:hypothetical protein
MSNREMEQNAEEQRDKEVANQLGLTEDELSSVRWEIEEHEHSGGGYYVQFGQDTPQEILDKAGAENYCVDVYFQDEPEQEAPEENPEGYAGDKPLGQFEL